MALEISIDPNPAKRSLEEIKAGFASLGSSAQVMATRIAGAFDKNGEAYQRYAAAQATAQRAAEQLVAAQRASSLAAQEEIRITQQRIAIQRQAIAGTISLAEAERRVAEAEIFLKTNNQQLAQQLARTRQEQAQTTAQLRTLAQGATEAGKATQLLQTSLGALGIATGIAGVVTALKAIVGEGIRYNAVLETQKIGLASLITSQQNIRTAQGRTLEGAEKFAAAQQLASGLMKQIQKDALQTTATTEQLVEAFQQALGPLSAAGLSLEQSREATLRIVQAASALGVPMHQVAQEVRAIAEGTIDQNARLAKVLQITPEIQRQAAQTGKLFDLIVDKTKAFALAGDATQQSFAGLTSSLSEMVSTLSARALSGPFIDLKGILGDVLQVLLEVNRQLDEASRKQPPGVNTGTGIDAAEAKQTAATLLQIADLVGRVHAIFADLLKIAADVSVSILGGFGVLVSPITGLIDALATGKGELIAIGEHAIASGRVIVTAFGDGIDRVRDIGEQVGLLDEEIEQILVPLARVEDASKVTWEAATEDIFKTVSAVHTLHTELNKFATSPPDLGPTKKQLEDLAKVARESADAVGKLNETAARQIGDIGLVRQESERAIARQFDAALAEAKKQGITDLTPVFARFQAQLQQNELELTDLTLQEEKKRTDAAIASTEARLSSRRAENDAAMQAAQDAVQLLEAQRDAAERAGAPLSEQASLLATLDDAHQKLALTVTQASRNEIALNKEILGILQQRLATQRAQAGQLQGKEDLVSQAKLKQIQDAITETTQKIQNQEAAIVSATASVTTAEQRLGIIEIQRGEAQVALTEQYLEEEAKRTQFAQEQIQARADLELQGVQQRIAAIQNQQGLEEATLALRREQGASTEELIGREKRLIDLEQQLARAAVDGARVKLEALRLQLEEQHELIAALQEQLRLQGEQGDFAGARATAGHLKDAAQGAVELTTKITEAKLGLDNMNAAAVRVGVEGKAGVAALTNELNDMRSVFKESDFRDFFSDILDADSLKDAGRILERESKNISKRTFEALLFGKEDNFDAPLIQNINGLFGVGDGGILGHTMQEGGKVQGQQWGTAVTTSAGQVMTSQFPQVASQSLAATEGIFAQQGTSAGTAFGRNALSSFKGVFGDGIGGVLDGVFRLFQGGGGGGGSGGIDAGGLFNMFKGLFGGAGETSATSFQSGFLGNFGQGFGGDFLNQSVGAGAVDWKAAGSSGGSMFGGGFLESFKSIFGGTGGMGGSSSGAGGFMSYLGLAQAGADIGKNFSKGNYGAGAGGAVGGAIGMYFGGPMGAAIGAQIGAAIGKIFDDLLNKQGRIDKEKDKLIRYFTRIFDIDFDKITEKAAAKGLEKFADVSPAAQALGAIFSGGLKNADIQGSTIRFAGQLLGNLRKMGDGADEVKDKLLELADAANFDLKDSVSQINAFTQASGAEALNLKNFQEEVKEAKKNLKEYGDTSDLTAAQLTELAAANGNTGSQIVTYTTLIGGAIDIGTRFNDFLDGQIIAQNLAAQSFLDAAEAAGSTGQAVTDLAEKVRTGNLSLEEAVIALNDMRKAAGLAKLSLDDVAIDPRKLEQTVAVLQQATQAFQDFESGLANLFEEGLNAGLSASDAGAKFDEFFNSTLRVSIIKAIVAGLVQGMAVEALKPFFTEFGNAFTQYVTGAISFDEFSARVAQVKQDIAPAAAALKDAFVEAYGFGEDVLRMLNLWPEPVADTTDKMKELQDEIAAIQDRLKEIDDQLFDIARKKIHVEIDLAANLERIGAITLLEKLEIESEGLQQEFDLLTQRLTEMGDAASLSVDDLQEAISLVQQMAALVVQKFQAEKAAIDDALRTEIEAIRARGKAQEDAIRAQFEAQRKAIEARIDNLEKEKDRINEVFDARMKALEEELAIAQEFQRVGEELRDTIIRLQGSQAAPVAPPGQLAFLERQAAALRAQLAGASAEDRPDLIRRLADILQQQLSLDVFQRPSDQYRDQFNAIVLELEQLRDQSLLLGSRTESIEEEMKALDIERNERLAAIDAQIEAARAELEALSAAEQAALAAAAASIEAEIQAAQDRADAKIDELREAAQAELERLAEIEKDLLSRQEQVLLSEKDVLLAQLTELQKLNVTAADLLRITYDGLSNRGAGPTAGDFTRIPPPDPPGPGGRGNAATHWEGDPYGPQWFTAGAGRVAPTRTGGGNTSIVMAPQVEVKVTITGVDKPEEVKRKIDEATKKAIEIGFDELVNSSRGRQKIFAIAKDAAKGVAGV